MAVELATAYVSLSVETRQVRPAVQRAFAEAEPDAEKAGRSHGERYRKGVVSAVVGMATAFKFAGAAAGGITRHIGAAATAISIAARVTRGFSVSLLASATLLRTMAGVSLARLAGVLRVIAAIAGHVAREISRITSALLVLQAVGKAVGALNNFAKSLRTIVVGGALAIGVISGLGTAFAGFGAVVASAAAAGAAALAGILGPAVAALKIGFSGLGDAAKAYQSGDGGAAQAKAVQSAARGLEQAEKGVERAKRDSSDAEKDLTRARKDAQDQIDDLNRSLRDNVLDEKAAAREVRQAKKDLAKTLVDPDADADDREEAADRVARAELRLLETQERNQDEQQKAAAANRAGVEGSDQVVQAKQRVVDANEAVAESEQQVVDALQALTDAQNQGSPDDAFDQMIGARMAPMLDAFKNLKHAVTDEFSAALTPAFSMFGGLLDNVAPKLAGLSSVFGTIGTEIAGSLSSPAGVAAFDQMTTASNQFFSALSVSENGLGGFTLGLAQFAATAAQTVSGSGAGINEMFLGWGEALRSISADQIREVFSQVAQVFSNIASVVGPLFSLFREVGAVSATALAPGFKAVGSAITEATPGMVQMAEILMPALSQVMQNLAPALPAIVQAFQPWAAIMAALAPHLASIVADLAPLAPWILAAATAVKVIAGAMVVWNATMAAASVAQGIFAAATGRSAASLGANTIALAAHRAALIAGAVAARGFAIAMAFITSPITLIVAGIAALVAGLVWFFTQTETGKRIWEATWSGIKSAMSAAWGFIQPILEGIGRFFTDTLAPAVMGFWHGVIEPALEGIKFAFEVWWAAVRIVFELWKKAFKLAGDVAMWLWRNAIQPAFAGIKAVFDVWWAGVQIVFDAWKTAFDTVGDVAMWLWQKILQPAFDGIGKILSGAWSVVKPIFEKFGAGIQAIGDIASKIGGTIKSAFDGIVEIVKKPIRVIGGLLAKIPTSILGIDIPGAGTIRSWGESMQRLRDGGQVAGRTRAGLLWGPGTGTSDSILGVDGRGMATALVSTGEWVTDEQTTKRWAWLLEKLPRLNTGGRVKRRPEGSVDGSGARGETESVPWLGNVPKPRPQKQLPAWIGNSGGDRDGDTEARPDSFAAEQQQGSSSDGGQVLGDGSGPLQASAGEDNLKPIAVLVRRMIFKFWPAITDIGGYRANDPFPEHPSGRALDIMVGNRMALGDEINSWIHKNESPFALKWTLWRQQEWDAGGATSPMSDRGSPTQNHMDHAHAFFDPVDVDPSRIPAGVVLPDGTVSTGTTSTDSGTTSTPASLYATTPSTDVDYSATGTSEKSRSERLSDSISENFGNAASAFVSGQISDLFGVIGFNDSPPWLKAYNEFQRSSDEFYGDKSGSTTTSPDASVSLPSSTTNLDEPTVNPQRPAGGQDLYAFNIATAAKEMGFGKDGATIGIAAGLAESGLRILANSTVPESLNYPHDGVGHADDSLGYMQQRPSQGWGSIAQLMDPVYPAQKFFDALGKVDWQGMAPHAAAQAVQGSAFADGSNYAAQMGPAADWVSRLKIFDKGGVMDPGDIGINLLKKPEAWLAPAEKSTIERIAKLDVAALESGRGAGYDGPPIVVNAYGSDAHQVSRNVISALELARMRYGGRP